MFRSATVALLFSLHATASASAVPQRLEPGQVSTAANEYNLSIDAGQRLRVFARSAERFEQARILFSTRHGAAWSAPREVPFSQAMGRDSDPWLSPDGRTLYFVSDRAGGDRAATRRDLDLWRISVAVTDAGTDWGVPEHLGATLNSEAEELGPELHSGTLYFNSSRPGGPAALSLYQAEQRADGGFAAPAPLPAPFNEGRAQGDFTLDADGRVALFWSVRGEGKDADLFAVVRRGTDWAPRAVRLPAPFSARGFDFTPTFVPGARTLAFASDRSEADAAGAGLGLSDLYVVPRALLDAALRDAADAPRTPND